MRLSELIEKLEELREDNGPDWDPHVYSGHQPSYPLAMGIAGVVHWSERERECPDHEGYLVDHDPDCREAYPPEEVGEYDDESVLWIVLSDGSPYERSPYAPRWLWEEGGWR